MCSRLLVVGLAGVACASLQTRRDKLVRVDGGLKVTPGKPFDHAWLAGYTRDAPQYAAEELAELLSRLPSPTFVEVFELHGAAAEKPAHVKMMNCEKAARRRGRSSMRA